MKRTRRIGIPAACLLAAAVMADVGAGCGPSVLIPVSAAAGGPLGSDSAKSPMLEVLMRSSVPEPLVLGRTGVAYSGLLSALQQQAFAVATPWVERHAAGNSGWQILIELTQAEASYSRGRATVTLALRATLRTRIGNEHLSQTQTHCQQTAQVEAAAAAPIFQACLHDLNAELSRWLGGTEP